MEQNSVKLREQLAANEALAAVNADLASAQGYAIRGVPYFILDGKLAVSGAQAPEGFLGALKQAADA